MSNPYPTLPADDDIAFLQLEHEFRRNMDHEISVEGRSREKAEGAYVNKVLAAAAALDIAELTTFTHPQAIRGKTVDVLQDTRNAIDQVVVRFRVTTARVAHLPRNGLAEDQKFRLNALLRSIQVEITGTAMDPKQRSHAIEEVNTLRARLENEELLLEHFVELGRAIAAIGKTCEQQADKCWRWFRIAMSLVSDSREQVQNLSENANEPVAHVAE